MISILLATYNGEKYLSTSIESILNQTFKDFELLIGFNGTTDSSKEIPSKYDDPRIRVFDYADEKGKSNTLNKLIKEAKYDWVAIQDDDDIWVNDKLEKQVPFMGRFDVIGSLICYVDENNNITGQPQLSTIPSEIKRISMTGLNQVANTSAILRKKDILDIGGWRNEFDGIEDYDLWLRLMRIGKNFINVPEQLVRHRLHSNSNFNTKQHNLSKLF